MNCKLDTLYYDLLHSKNISENAREYNKRLHEFNIFLQNNNIKNPLDEYQQLLNIIPILREYSINNLQLYIIITIYNEYEDENYFLVIHNDEQKYYSSLQEILIAIT